MTAAARLRMPRCPAGSVAGTPACGITDSGLADVPNAASPGPRNRPHRTRACGCPFRALESASYRQEIATRVRSRVAKTTCRRTARDCGRSQDLPPGGPTTPGQATGHRAPPGEQNARLPQDVRHSAGTSCPSLRVGPLQRLLLLPREAHQGPLPTIIWGVSAQSAWWFIRNTASPALPRGSRQRPVARRSHSKAEREIRSQIAKQRTHSDTVVAARPRPWAGCDHAKRFPPGSRRWGASALRKSPVQKPRTTAVAPPCHTLRKPAKDRPAKVPGCPSGINRTRGSLQRGAEGGLERWTGWRGSRRFPPGP